MEWFSSDFDRLDPDDRKLLAMPLLALVSLALLLLEHDHLFAALVLKDLGRNDRSSQGGVAHPEIRAFSGRQDVLDLHDCALFRVRESVHDEYVALGNCELLPLGLDSGSHEINRLISGLSEFKARLFWRFVVEDRGRADAEAEADLETHRQVAV